MKTVIVTGSSRGIGFAVAKAFVLRGDRVVLNCRKDKVQLNKALEELRIIAPEKVIGICADISDYADCGKMFKEAEDTFGCAEVLVNNAGAEYFGLFSEMQPQKINETIAANLMTAINAAHIAVPNMVRAKSGCIINISSIWGICGASCEAVYSAAKAGINGFTKALAKELAPSGIRVNAIACGAFETRMNDRLSAHEKNAFAENIPLGRFGNPSEAADLAVFLASESAGYLTGQIIPLDGGVI
jgi:3-oxoacyl-[acyl-carrier protein] reductase